MRSKIAIGVVALGMFGAGLTLQPVIAQPQENASISGLRNQVQQLETRVARLEENAEARLRPAN